MSLLEVMRCRRGIGARSGGLCFRIRGHTKCTYARIALVQPRSKCDVESGGGIAVVIPSDKGANPE
jgi:hypothetical protein